MSFQMMTLALKANTGSTGTKFVLLAVANYCDEYGQCYPSQQRLAKDTLMSVRSVRTHLAKLEAQGFITRLKRFENGKALTDIIKIQAENIASCTVGKKRQNQEENIAYKPINNNLLTTHIKKDTVIPVDWTVGDAEYQYASDMGYSDQQIKLIGEDFYGYWRSTNKKKYDWYRTWQTWVRNERIKPDNNNERKRQVLEGMGIL